MIFLNFAVKNANIRPQNRRPHRISLAFSPCSPCSNVRGRGSQFNGSTRGWIALHVGRCRVRLSSSPRQGVATLPSDPRRPKPLSSGPPDSVLEGDARKWRSIDCEPRSPRRRQAPGRAMPAHRTALVHSAPRLGRLTLACRQRGWPPCVLDRRSTQGRHLLSAAHENPIAARQRG
jgi:hypothetical protein